MLFLAIVSISAQEKGTKNTKPIKYTKGTNSSVIVEKEVKTEKTTPVSIRPTNSNSTNRAAVNSTNSREVNTMRPEKVKVNTNRAAQNSNETMRPEKVKVNTNRAAQTTVETNRPEKPVIIKEKEEKTNLNRAAQSEVITDKPEKVKEEKPRKEKPSKKERKEKQNLLKIQKSNNPKQAHRYGIKLDGLPRSIRQFLIENRSLNEWANDVQFLEQIIRIESNNLKLKNSTKRNKLYFDCTTETPVPMDDLVESYDTVEWTCAISMKPIQSKFNNFSLENFIHPEYLDVLEAPMVDSRILKSSVEFRKYCKKLLLEEQKEFMRVIKKGSTIN